MARSVRKNLRSRSATTTKYDAHNTVLDKAYGALADLRRELADSREAVAERSELLDTFASCKDSQRSWLLLEDYFERLSLARKDFGNHDWWPRILSASGRARLEEMALLFLRAQRSLPTELSPYANLERFAQIEQSEKEQSLVHDLEQWLVPPVPNHLDAPRASIKALCKPVHNSASQPVTTLQVDLVLSRPRTGERSRTLQEIIELTSRATHEQELFPPADWEFIQWLASHYAAEFKNDTLPAPLHLRGLDLLQWLARWGQSGKLLLQGTGKLEPLHFLGQSLRIVPKLENGEDALALTHQLQFSSGETQPLSEASFFDGYPPLALVQSEFFILQNPPPANLLDAWRERPSLPVSKLSRRLLTELRKNGGSWEQLCVTHSAHPRFVFELQDEVIHLRLLAESDLDESLWEWNGHDWHLDPASSQPRDNKPQILDDPRLDAACAWLRRLDWFTPEPGLWVADANEIFLHSLGQAWPDRPPQAAYLGNSAFNRLFLNPQQLRPKLIVQGSGIDWFAVSAQWEAEGLKLTPADLERLQSATGRFVQLPDAGWMQLDEEAVREAHEAMADVGVDGLCPIPQRVDLLHAAQMDDEKLERFTNESGGKKLRQHLAKFEGVKSTPLPEQVQASMRPYQLEGFSFLCHLTELNIGGILADDMGLGKTLQTLSWIAWLQARPGAAKPCLVICPASVLHNWRREAEKFTPHLKVLVLESGAARHNLRQRIPQHNIIVTNYSLLRRDLAALQKFQFEAIILDEAQFIKNPTAQVTQSVKKLRAGQRLALTGTPLENRLLDLWSITDFVQPGYLGTEEQFNERYEPKGAYADWAQRVARRRLSARLRPILLRRLKTQVARDLPERIEERRDCDLGESQRKLYLAELRRSREQIMKAVREKGVSRSRIHVLAALTRLRQVCCHPQLVGNDCPSGKTETLFELLEPLIAQGHKVLVFSQFVQMLQLLEKECALRQLKTFTLTGQSKHRQEIVSAFQAEPDACIFLLSLRAAGTGLNLTNASYVILYDPWWNPAVEAQAIDRSHRIGQTQTVNAYRLIAPGTVEEKIWDLQQRKSQTISDVLGEEGFARSLDSTDLNYLFSED